MVTKEEFAQRAAPLDWTFYMLSFVTAVLVPESTSDPAINQEITRKIMQHVAAVADGTKKHCRINDTMTDDCIKIRMKHDKDGLDKAAAEALVDIYKQVFPEYFV